MSKILIIGGAGYIGTRMSNQLYTSGHDISVIDKFWFGDFLLPKISKQKQDLFFTLSFYLCNLSLISLIYSIFDD